MMVPLAKRDGKFKEEGSPFEARVCSEEREDEKKGCEEEESMLCKMLFVVVLLVSGARCQEALPLTMVVVTCSGHYTDFFENWLAWVSRSLDLVRSAGLICVAEDREAYEYLVRRFEGEAGYRLVVRQSEATMRTSLTFESPGFAKMMSRRASYLAIQLENLMDKKWPPEALLIFSDLDVVWLRDPRPYFIDDCDAWAQTQHRERKTLNPGFLVRTSSST